MTRLVLNELTFVGAFDSSALEPFFDTLRDTAYPVSELVFTKCPLRPIDVMVTVRDVLQALLESVSALVDNRDLSA